VFFVLPLSAQTTKDQLQNMYLEYLTEQGYLPDIDEDGDIKFKYEGGTYYILVFETDLQYFELVYPNFWEIESQEELDMVKTVISYVNRSTKIAKIYLNSREDNVSVSAESLLTSPEDFKNCFSRLLSIIKSGRDKFRTEMNKTPADSV
jgi:hypothetical protein